jgi:DegV family protein with EDD domain
MPNYRISTHIPKQPRPAPKFSREPSRVWLLTGAQAILSIHISETLSATVNSARIAAQQFTRIPITVLDSGQLSLGVGFIVERAAQLTASGKEPQKIISDLNNLMERVYVFASLKMLAYLRRSGRMNFALAGFGELLQLKGIGTLGFACVSTE